MCLSLGISCPEGVRASAETSAGDVVNNRMCAQVFRLEGGTEMIREDHLVPHRRPTWISGGGNVGNAEQNSNVLSTYYVSVGPCQRLPITDVL